MRQRRCPDNALSDAQAARFGVLVRGEPPLDETDPRAAHIPPPSQVGTKPVADCARRCSSPQTDDVVAMIRAGVGRTRTRLGSEPNAKHRMR